ncbi:MAG: nucleoside-diphosphate sugar epimerase/dehydratase [Verrucomicrobiota bacterium]
MNSLHRTLRHGVVVFLYVLLAVVSLTASYLLRFDFTPTAADLRQLLTFLPLLIAVKLLVLVFMGQFQSLLTFFSVPDFLRIVRAGVAATLIFLVIWWISGGTLTAPRSVLVMDGIFFIGLVSGSRLLLRNIRDQWESVSLTKDRHLEPVAIVGAGEVGAQLAQQFMRHSGCGLSPVVFLDDDRGKWGRQMHGIPIAGDPSWLLGPHVPASLRRVIIAMPSAQRKRIRAIVAMLEGKGFRLDTIHSINELLETKSTLTRLRPIQIDDLLGREPAKLDSAGIRQMLAGRVVAVTGAGGSIGSELCRQILRFKPEKLLLIEQSEGLLFIIEQELIEAGFKPLIVPLVADICDVDRLTGIFAEHSPVILFHAAAHKHVPMMESQPVEAIKNNAMGTSRLARVALSAGVQRFVLISTDKAINPTSVMGATKRMAEMFLQALRAQHPDRTRFICVRFGNVLGSSGSVVPIFQKQIAAGGPVKVTHPEVTRYFMTIPEAVGLVLQSGMMGSGGEIFLLDMGKPVKIVDLARSLILLQGLKPEEDIAIQFTGLRTGEKMYEELNYNSEELQPTEHHKVFRLVTSAPQLDTVTSRLAELEASFKGVSINELKLRMTRLVPEYTPDIKPAKIAPPAPAVAAMIPIPRLDLIPAA